jgi:hypothetical protein
MVKHLTIFFLAAAVIAFSACTRHLTRSQAKAQLEKAAKQEQDKNPDGPHCLLLKVGKVADCEASRYPPNYDPVEWDKTTAVLSATGYVTVHPIKQRVWDVELTELGTHSISGEKYAHNQRGDCDDWQVTIPLCKYDHLDVTGIVEEGVHAKVDATLTFVITPVGMAVRKSAPTKVFEVNKKIFGEEMAHKFLSNDLETLLGDDLIYAPLDKDRYFKKAVFAFEKYDDGWKLMTK